MRTGISGLGSRYKNLPVENNRGSDISQIIHIFVRNRNVTTMEQTLDNISAANGKEAIAAHRERIVAAICLVKDKDGNARYTEEQARGLSEELSDEDLAFGMDYNTPEEVAELLVDSGLD